MKTEKKQLLNDWESLLDSLGDDDTHKPAVVDSCGKLIGGNFFEVNSKLTNVPVPLTASNLNGSTLVSNNSTISSANPMDSFFENCKNLSKAKISVTWEKNCSSFQMMLWENGNMIVTKDGQPVEQSDLTEEEVLFYIKMKKAIGAQ